MAGINSAAQADTGNTLTWLSQGSSTLQRGVYHTIPTQHPTTTVYMAASGQAGHVYELTLHNEHGLTHIVSDNERLLQLAAPDPHHPGVTNPGVVDLKPIKHLPFISMLNDASMHATCANTTFVDSVPDYFFGFRLG